MRYYLLLLTAIRLLATDYYVDGSSGGGGSGSIGSPWNSISSITGVVDGDNLYFKKGTTVTGTLSVNWNGTSSVSPSIIGAYGSGARPIIDATGVNNAVNLLSGANELLISGLNLKSAAQSNLRIRALNQNITVDDCLIEGAVAGHGITLDGSHFRLSNSILKNNGTTGSHHGIYVDTTGASTDIILESTETTGNTGSGFKINSGNLARVSGIIIRYCNIHGNGNHGIEDEAADAAQYYYNLIYGNGVIDGGNEIFMSSNAGTFHSRSNVIYNNVLVHGIANYASIKAQTGSTGHWLTNNVIYPSGTAFYLEGVSSGAFSGVDYNCYYGGTTKWILNGSTYTTFASWKAGSGFDANSFNQDPGFESYGSNDYRLAYGSVLIDAGYNLGATRDYANNPVLNTPDIGAYEYQSATRNMTSSGTLTITGTISGP